MKMGTEKDKKVGRIIGNGSAKKLVSINNKHFHKKFCNKLEEASLKILS